MKIIHYIEGFVNLQLMISWFDYGEVYSQNNEFFSNKQILLWTNFYVTVTKVCYTHTPSLLNTIGKSMQIYAP